MKLTKKSIIHISSKRDEVCLLSQINKTLGIKEPQGGYVASRNRAEESNAVKGRGRMPSILRGGCKKAWNA